MLYFVVSHTEDASEYDSFLEATPTNEPRNDVRSKHKRKVNKRCVTDYLSVKCSFT